MIQAIFSIFLLLNGATIVRAQDEEEEVLWPTSVAKFTPDDLIYKEFKIKRSPRYLYHRNLQDAAINPPAPGRRYVIDTLIKYVNRPGTSTMTLDRLKKTFWQDIDDVRASGSQTNSFTDINYVESTVQQWMQNIQLLKNTPGFPNDMDV